MLLRASADQIDDLLVTEMRTRRIPGAALALIQHGVVVKTACYGLANLELGMPVTTNTVFEIGSITKQFTAACILLLQQQGKLSVEDRIASYLKNTPAAWSNITIRHLLTHTSGIKSYTGLDGFEWRRHLTQDQFIKRLGEQEMEFLPGAAWRYSNSGFNLLGYIVENVSGTNYLQFLRGQLLQPLGMSATTDRNPSVLIPNRAAGYEQTNQIHINRDYDLTDVFSAGALVSTISDLARWNAALDSTNLLSAASKASMWQPQTLNDGKPTRYGFGWFIETIEKHRVIGHGGATSGFSASIQRFQDDQLTVLLLTNTDEMIATSLARQVALLYLNRRG
jgi:D-alanyl-D-alanine carboxypeptidase